MWKNTRLSNTNFNSCHKLGGPQKAALRETRLDSKKIKKTHSGHYVKWVWMKNKFPLLLTPEISRVSPNSKLQESEVYLTFSSASANL